jgi:hypothetical protein
MKHLWLPVLFGALLVGGSSLTAFADPLQGAIKQRIGNYDLEMTTMPKPVPVGSPTTIMLRFSGVNGDDLVDVPVAVAISKDGNEVYRTTPAIVPYGHYSFNYTFLQPGGYALYVYLTDAAYSGQVLTFTFPMTAAGVSEQAIGMLPLAGAVAAGAAGALVVFRRRRLAAKH